MVQAFVSESPDPDHPYSKAVQLPAVYSCSGDEWWSHHRAKSSSHIQLLPGSGGEQPNCLSACGFLVSSALQCRRDRRFREVVARRLMSLWWIPQRLLLFIQESLRAISEDARLFLECKWIELLVGTKPVLKWWQAQGECQRCHTEKDIPTTACSVRHCRTSWIQCCYQQNYDMPMMPACGQPWRQTGARQEHWDS